MTALNVRGNARPEEVAGLVAGLVAVLGDQAPGPAPPSGLPLWRARRRAALAHPESTAATEDGR